jgi:hypothetical protein
VAACVAAGVEAAQRALLNEPGRHLYARAQAWKKGREGLRWPGAVEGNSNG